ncbi:GAF and ANTAR domain-containing protein [Paeniglutamicibacter sp.]|uniref:GAF and ANTAR domain-containing protein n=1 Tax=Paeniglutamicibacter sp. TaxID=1934391 RepID=UPI0039891198
MFFGELCDLVSEMEDLQGLLESLAVHASAALSRVLGARVECSVALHRNKHPATIAGSDARVVLLEGVGKFLDEGPFRHALRTGLPVILPDSSDSRWPGFEREMTVRGFTGLLVIPLDVGPRATATLNLFAGEIDIFSNGLAPDALGFADEGSRALRMALRIADAERKTEDLSAALEYRTAIDLARGIVMAQSRCTAAEAFEVLCKASSNRNQKLHDVAFEVVSRFARSPALTHFEP